MALTARGFLATLVLVSVSLLGAADAWAAGNATLEPYILSNPVPGWTPAPTSVSQRVDTEVSGPLVARTHENVTTALGVWEGPGGNGVLIIILVRFPGSSIPASFSNSTSAINGVCGGAGQSPGTVTPIAGIPGAASETCQSSSGNPLTVAAWPKGNVVAFVEAEGLGATEVDQVAVNEDDKLPANGIGEASSSSSSGLEAGIGVVVVAAVVIGIIVARRRSKAQVAPAAGGQWAPPGATPPWGYEGAQAASPGATPYGGPGGYAAGPPAYPAGGYPAGGYPAGSSVPPAGAPAGGYAAGSGGYPSGSGFDAGAAPAEASGPVPYQRPRPSEGGDAGFYGGTQPAAAPTPVRQAPPVVGGNDATVIDAPPPAAAPDHPVEAGWHAVEGDPNRQRYWDGTAWTSHLRWDGTAWVNDS
jgi:hypothetical protein